MKKITVWLLTLAFAATMLAGCGSKTDTTETTETTEATSAADETSDGAADTTDTSEDEELLTGLPSMCKIMARFLWNWMQILPRFL